MKEDEILNKIAEDPANTGHFNLGSSYLAYKLNEKLLNQQSKLHLDIITNQNQYNDKQLSYSRNLVYGTWALAIATILLVIVTLYAKQ